MRYRETQILEIEAETRAAGGALGRPNRRNPEFYATFTDTIQRTVELAVITNANKSTLTTADPDLL